MSDLREKGSTLQFLESGGEIWKPRRVKGGRHKLLVVTLRIALAGSFILLWQVLGDLGVINQFFFSSPAAIAEWLWQEFSEGEIWKHIIVTLREAVYGFAIGSIAGILIGFMLGQFRLVEEVLTPFLNLANTLPRVALAPLFILLFGIGEASKVALVVTVVVFILIFNTYAGTQTVEDDYMMTARLLGASRGQITRTIVLPWTVPWIFAGLQIALAWSLGAAVIGEFLAARAGVGYRIFYAVGLLDNTGVLGGCVVLLGMAYILFKLLQILESYVLKWKPDNLR